MALCKLSCDCESKRYTYYCQSLFIIIDRCAELSLATFLRFHIRFGCCQAASYTRTQSRIHRNSCLVFFLHHDALFVYFSNVCSKRSISQFRFDRISHGMRYKKKLEIHTDPYSVHLSYSCKHFVTDQIRRLSRNENV